MFKSGIIFGCLWTFYTSAFANNLVDAENFANSKAWINLLHYQEKSNGKYEGMVVNEDFYVDKNGKFSPLDELNAEINAFNSGNRKCEFPARFELLKKQGLVTGDLKDCTEYQNFMGDVQPKGITLLFTNAYMSNPASLFGHTLIRIDTARKGTQMLAHASNFGANSGTEYGVWFAIKGLFGGYDGVYSVSPYWEIINTYNNIENRDIWEYKLNLSSEEEKQFVNHLYEMRNARIPYLFLSKNCSYMILELIEAVRPDLELTDDYPAWAIPLDTLKTVRSVSGLISEINYRPARYTKIKFQLDNMSDNLYSAFLKGIKEDNFDMTEVEDRDKPVVLETLYQYYQYQYNANEMDLATYRKNSFVVLRRRSVMPMANEILPKGEDPSISHDSFQFSVGGGIFNHHSFEEIELRPAYTALTDSSKGLIKGAEISVFASSWRYYNHNHKFVLQSFTPIKIKSLVPASRVFSPISYATNVEIKRAYNSKTEEEGYVGAVNMGIGRTYALWGDVWIYGLLKLGGEYGGFIDGNQWGGILPEIGLYKDFGKFRLHSIVEKTWATRHFGEKLSYKVMASFGINENISMDSEYTENHYEKGHNVQELIFKLRYNF